MSHPLQRNTHRAHLYHEVGTGEYNRDGSERTEWQQYATFGTRLTDAGGSFGQTLSGERDTEMPILSGPGRLIDEGLNEGQNLALEGDGFEFDAAAPEDGDWFEVTNVSMLFGLGHSVRGVEIELSQVS